jgi:ABC-2 type transport system permease protein
MMEFPLLVLYVGSIVNVHGGAAVWAQTRALIPGLLVGLMWAVVLAAISLFLASLTGRRAFATGSVAIFFLLTYTLSQILLQVETNAAIAQHGAFTVAPGKGPVPVPASVGEKVAALFSPFTLFDGVTRWLGGNHSADNVLPPGSFGAVYAVVLLVILALCLAGLAARYRKARLS